MSDFLATAYTRNGDRHFGWCSEWSDGTAVIGGTRIDGVVFLDALKTASGGSVPDDTPGSRPGDHDTPTHGAVVPADGFCRCGHSRTWHSNYGVCCAEGCLCDRHRPHKTNAAG